MKRKVLAVLAAAVTSGVTLVGAPAPVTATGLSTTDLTSGVTATDLAQDLAGAGVSVSNVVFTGNHLGGGRFAGGGDAIGFESGVVLSSGAVGGVVGPNVADGTTGSNDAPGDADLDLLTDGLPTYDASVLEFDFVPSTASVQFTYVFASEEYNEYVHSIFNDVFGFFVNGENCALVPESSSPVSINTINNGNPYGVDAVNPAYYRNNDLEDGGGSIDTEMDGLTTALTCVASVQAGEVNHMKLAIADASDASLDSAVFLQAGSLVSITPTTLDADPVVASVLPGAEVFVPNVSAVLRTDAGTPLAGRAVDFAAGAEPICSAVTNTAGRATCSGVGVTVSALLEFGYRADFAGDGSHGASSGAARLVRVNGDDLL